MSEKIKNEVRAALDSGDLNRAVDRLKTGLRRDPYWEWGHRKLGDIYLESLNHTKYALVQYRKLQKIKDELKPSEILRLAWAYQEREFQDKVSELLSEIDTDSLPETIELAGESYDARERFDWCRKAAVRRVEEDSEEFFEKYRRRARQYQDHGNFFEAQQAYETALEFHSDEDVRLELARCLIQRSRYPEALQELKALRSREESGDEVDQLFDKIYSRLGLDNLFEPRTDDEDRPGQSRKVS